MNYFKIKKENIIIFILFFLIIILSYRVVFLKKEYAKKVDNKIIIQEFKGVKYKIYPNEEKLYKIIIGDIIGINKKSYKMVDELGPSLDESLLLIPGIKKDYIEINSDIFFSLISNKNNVFIPDNFCVEDWPTDINKDIYSNSNLGRGAYCGSEAETKKIDNLIKQYNPQKIDIYYSSEIYRELIEGFLLYLDELNIFYEMIEIK